jgi:hypothetical protein
MEKDEPPQRNNLPANHEPCGEVFRRDQEMKEKTLNEIHKQGIDALVKVLGPNRLRYDSSRFMIREAAITPKIRKQWLEADPDKYLAAVIAH